MKGRVAVLVMFLCGVCGPPVFAGVETHTVNVPLQILNIDTTVDLPLYDSTAVLKSVKLTLEGHVEGEVRYENQSQQAGIITWALQAVMTLKRPDLTTLVVALPGLGGSESRSAYDGVTDFAGTSGRTLLGLSADKVEGSTFTGAADLALFTGVGNLSLPFTGVSTSFAAGPGTMASQFMTSGSALLTVEYTYGDPIPEPAGLGLISLGLLALLRRRRMT